MVGGGVQNFWAGYQIAPSPGNTYDWSQTASSTGSWGAAVTAICPQATGSGSQSQSKAVAGSVSGSQSKAVPGSASGSASGSSRAASQAPVPTRAQLRELESENRALWKKITGLS